jgi:uncharacterized protein YkwD
MRNPVASLTLALTLLALGVALSVSAPARAASPRLDRAERSVIRAINHRRAAYGLGRLHAGRRLSRAADYHSREMAYANYFAHPSLNGSSMRRRVHRYTHSRRIGETLAMLGGGCRRHMARMVVNMWMGSSPHRAILLSGRYHHVGVARRGGHGRCMVTADFSG